MTTDSRSEVEAQAAHWLSILDGPVDAATLAGLKQWGAKSPLHVKEFVDQLAVQEVLLLTARDDDVPAVHSAAPAAVDVRAGERSGMAAPVRKAGLALAASVILVAALVAFGRWYPTRSLHYEASAQSELITLNDGSSVRLYAPSSMTVRLFPDRREVQLRGVGAVFNVTHDATRPFSVSNERLRVKVLGTVFNMVYRDGETRIRTFEGKVQVMRGGEIEPVGAGEFVAVPGSGRLGPAQKAADRKRDPVDVTGQTLAQIADRFNKSGSDIWFEVSAEVADKRFGGSADLAAPEIWVKVLEKNRSLHVESQPGFARISARAPAPAQQLK